jgi:AraC family transcriptional regulator of adaptative response/methylated-DNA-[protein]-cysteine methyltransferase
MIMNTQETINYQRIAEAINYIKLNFKTQPNLDEVAEKVNLSPFHFQRLFTDWAGISPKKFLQYLSLEYAKSILKDKQATLFDTAYETGLSGTGRLHDLFINIEGMTPAEYKNGGRELSINYSFAESPFGNIIVASTPKGICHIAFADDGDNALIQLKQQFPNAAYTQVVDIAQQDALFIFKKDWSELSNIKLHLKGTSFQLKVWEALLKIPMGGLYTYSAVSQQIHAPNASRAVGSAIGANPVAFLIPCHRVIKSTGEFGQYHWGSARKSAIIGWEAALVNDSVSI